MKQLIYADNAATTKLSSKALDAMLPYLSSEYGNPSSLYSIGQKSKNAITSARRKIANCIGALESEIYFTSCGTESDNWAIKGAVYDSGNKNANIITSNIEHHAILHSCENLKLNGYSCMTLPVDDKGFILKEQISEAINENTVIVTIMFGNNEIGTIQNVQEFAEVAHENGVLFHTDAVQCVGHIPIDVHVLNVDMMSASAHKFNGPKGVGFLYIKSGIAIAPFMDGGAQEYKHRAGTENVAGIVGMSIALEDNVNQLAHNMAHTNNLSEYTFLELKKQIPNLKINGSMDNRIPGNVNVSFPNVSGEGLLHILDLKGICISAGSACNSQETVASHVIQALKLPTEYMLGTIRISYGKDSTIEDAKAIVKALADFVNRQGKE